ncbi:MAG TPA: SDR family NAD(P)-dependent oxidoreductase [Pararhizobium sp.]|uniref:SDR family NAD(P)-dependent oxidoreductase n=1 Tax=Pararhizobium sp. TaxID=1977563 RepID=UPI002B7032E8|nr:SDR family NAD(P)-dependent oxidoreductase [Pararhizobium sp.]HTO32299.1 SDR family NAD(P)-dependent oxidoreductase [Pararhizobium sp.]
MAEDLMVGRVDGKVALITGAGSGVGRAVMMRFAEEGAIVIGVGRTKATIEETAALVKAKGGIAYAHMADLSESAPIEAVVSDVVREYGRIDCLVHAAGVGYSWAEKSPGSMNDVATTSPEKWREVIGINLDGFYHSAHAVLPHMIANGGGSIVAVASISGMVGLPVAHAYCAAKAGVINLTRAMATAYAEKNIRTNCIAPGFIATPMVESVLSVFEDRDAALAITPMGRPGTPEEMANGCLYLASDEASYCNGSVLVIDGGSTARQ